MLQPHACAQHFRFRILRRTRSFPGRTSTWCQRLRSVTDLLADLLALTGLATLDGLTAQGNVGDQLLCNDVNCTELTATCQVE